MQEIKKYLNSPKANTLVLDVREPEEFAEGHVPGAKNIPLGEVSQHLTEIKSYQRILLYCRSGKRAQIATMELEGQGVLGIECVAQGGMITWED